MTEKDIENRKEQEVVACREATKDIMLRALDIIQTYAQDQKKYTKSQEKTRQRSVKKARQLREEKEAVAKEKAFVEQGYRSTTHSDDEEM